MAAAPAGLTAALQDRYRRELAAALGRERFLSEIRLTATRMSSGTPQYMSPEHTR